jgi:DNA-binding transcriptional LysR family regulator
MVQEPRKGRESRVGHGGSDPQLREAMGSQAHDVQRGLVRPRFPAQGVHAEENRGAACADPSTKAPLVVHKCRALVHDWDDVRYFLAVARAGTLARAARDLGVDQTTVGRRVAALEEAVGARLFDRASTGYVLTTAGARVVEAAEAMEASAGEVEARALGADARLAGTVRVATTESLAEHFIVGALTRVRAVHPEIDVVLATGWRSVSLLRREADVAVRLVRPNHPRLSGRRLASFALRLYAAPSYVAARGEPRGSLDGHDLLVYEEALGGGSRKPLLGEAIDRARIALQANSATVLVRAAVEGLGIVELPSYVGDPHARLVRVLPERQVPCSVWLVLHQDLRRTARVRVVCEAFAAAFTK